MAWQRFRVQLKGEAAPVEVQTSARDYSTVVMDPNAPKALDFQFRITHNALVRTGVDGVPRDYDSFLEVLDGIPEAVDEEDPDVLTPTPPDR